MENPVCLLAGGLIDLILAKDVAADTDKKLRINAELSEKNQHLSSLYMFIKESRPMNVDGLASEYAFIFSDKRMKRLIQDAKVVDSVIQNIRAEIAVIAAVSGTH